MITDNETVAEVCSVLYTYPKAEVCDGNGLTVLNNNKIADRILAAHKRELIKAIKPIEENYEYALEQIDAKDAEIAKLRTLTTHTDNSEVIAELERRLKVAEEIIETAGCLTHMSVVEVVSYKASHNHFKINEDLKIVTIDDPIAKRYSLLEKQMIPVFNLLKEKVEQYRKEGGAK